MHSIGIISTFPPTQCGIATYSNDLVQSLKSITPLFHFTKIELSSDTDHCSNKNFIIQNDDVQQYKNAAQYINSSGIDIVDIQHEFKIFGKPDGENILILLNQIKKPIITTLHTVFSNLNERREKILFEIIKRSDMLYVFSEEAKKHIVNKYKKQSVKIKTIPHGVPSIKFREPHQIQERKNFPVDIVFVSAGHMRKTKGYELAITALHSLRNEIPDFHYLILGSNHPENETAQLYRETLVELVAKLNLTNQVTFVCDYLEQEDFIKYIQSADICLLPYTSKDQSSSGVLALMLACGRPLVSTPFQFATSYINEFSGILSDSFNSNDFQMAIRGLLNKKHLWKEIDYYNYKTGQDWNWEKVAYKYSLGYSKIIGK